jgi:hypothetical protein
LVAKPPHPLRKQLNRRASRLKRPGRRTGLFPVVQLQSQFKVNEIEFNFYRPSRKESSAGLGKIECRLGA